MQEFTDPQRAHLRLSLLKESFIDHPEIDPLQLCDYATIAGQCALATTLRHNEVVSLNTKGIIIEEPCDAIVDADLLFGATTLAERNE